VQPRDKKARLRALCAARGYHPEDLPGGWAYKLHQIDIGHAIYNVYYLRFRVGAE
jgi:hypothetical protein